jgi:hypothetical protein
MRGSVFGTKTSTSRGAWLAAICLSAALLSGAVHADDDRGRRNDRRFHSENHSSVHKHWRDHRHDDDRDDRRRDRGHRRSDWGDRDYRRADWRYYGGRYWAPAHYRGRHCTDRRHYHGVHYHVAARDYYDYYYPRYRYYGSRPLGANASVIITVPLF